MSLNDEMIRRGTCRLGLNDFYPRRPSNFEPIAASRLVPDGIEIRIPDGWLLTKQGIVTLIRWCIDVCDLDPTDLFDPIPPTVLRNPTFFQELPDDRPAAPPPPPPDRNTLTTAEGRPIDPPLWPGKGGRW